MSLYYKSLILSESSLISYYRLDETSGTTLVDQKGVNNGTYVGSPGYSAPGGITGDPDTAILWPGPNTTYARCKTGTILASLTNATFECWFRNSQSGASIYPGLYCERAFRGNDIWQVTISSTTDPSGFGHLEFNHQDDTSALDQVNTPITVNDGNWHYCAVVKQGATCNIYVDGFLQKTQSISNSNTFTNAGLESRIAGDKSGDGGSYTLFAGTIDEVALYNDALSYSQIQQHWLNGAAQNSGGASATDIWTDLLSSSDFSVAGSIGKLLKDNIDAMISSRLATGASVAGVTGDLAGKVIGGGSSTITGVGALANTTDPSNDVYAALTRANVDASTYTPTDHDCETTMTVDVGSAEWMNQGIIWTSGPNRGLTCQVTGYGFTMNNKVKLAFTRVGTVPTNGDSFVRIGKIGV